MFTQEEIQKSSDLESERLRLCKLRFPSLDWRSRGSRFTGVARRDRTLLIIEVWEYFHGSEERWNAGFRLGNRNQCLVNGKSANFEESLNNLFLRLQALNQQISELIGSESASEKGSVAVPFSESEIEQMALVMTDDAIREVHNCLSRRGKAIDSVIERDLRKKLNNFFASELTNLE